MVGYHSHQFKFYNLTISTTKNSDISERLFLLKILILLILVLPLWIYKSQKLLINYLLFSPSSTVLLFTLVKKNSGDKTLEPPSNSWIKSFKFFLSATTLTMLSLLQISIELSMLLGQSRLKKRDFNSN